MDKRQRFHSALAAGGMLPGQVGIVTLADSSWSIVVGYFSTTVFYSRVTSMAPKADLFPLTVISISLCMFTLWCMCELLESRMFYKMWKTSEDWCMMMIKCASIVRAGFFFLCSHLFFGLLIDRMDDTYITLLQCFLAIPAVVLLLQFTIVSSSKKIRQI